MTLGRKVVGSQLLCPKTRLLFPLLSQLDELLVLLSSQQTLRTLVGSCTPACAAVTCGTCHCLMYTGLPHPETSLNIARSTITGRVTKARHQASVVNIYKCATSSGNSVRLAFCSGWLSCATTPGSDLSLLPCLCIHCLTQPATHHGSRLARVSS